MVAPKRLMMAGTGLMGFSIVFFFITFPMIFKSQVKKAVRLLPGDEMRDMWSSVPFPLHFYIYVFNVTNAEEVANGGKPKLQEVGPFVYDEYKDKVDLVDRESDDSLEYSPKNTFYFNSVESRPLTGDEEIIFPHLLMLGIPLITLKEKPAALSVVGKGVDSIFKKPASLFVKVKVKDLLFNGIPFDCTVKDFAGSAICNVLKTEGIDDLMVDGEGLYRFAIFGPKNGTVIKQRLRVLRGKKNFKDVGRVIELDGKTENDVWPGEFCNTFNGTDSTIFHPLRGTDDLPSFTWEMCRSLSAYYVGPSQVKGIKTARFTADYGDMSSDPNLQCFCPTPETCLDKGLYDLYKCVKSPVVASLPHFLQCDEKYVQAVEGLHPDEEKHGIKVDMELTTATPLYAAKRTQFNMFVFPIEKYRLMKTFPTVLFPLFWVEEGILLGDEFVKQIKDAFKVLVIVKWMKWLTLLGGMGLSGYSFYRMKKVNSTAKLEITKVSPKTNRPEGSGQEKKWPPVNISTVQSAMHQQAHIDRS